MNTISGSIAEPIKEMHNPYLSRPDTDYKTWSNHYDGNIDKAVAANKGVDEYFEALNWECPIPPLLL